MQLFLRGESGPHDGSTTVTIGPKHPQYEAFWPFPGVPLGLHELKAVEARNLIEAIHEGKEAYPSFREGWHVIEVLEAAGRSHDQGQWADVVAFDAIPAVANH